MSAKNQKNLIVVGGVVVALLVGSVLLGGFTKSEPAVNETTAKVGACPASGCDSCPAAKTCGSEKAEGSCCGKTCPADCTKACCADKASEGCCAEKASEGCSGEPKPADCCGCGANEAKEI